jgi:hypothetical protein
MITINWGSPDKTILQYEFEGSWAVDDLIEALDAGVEVASRYDHDIDVIVDMSQSGLPNLFGTNINKAFSRALNRTEQHIEQSNKEPGMVAIVTNNPIMRNSLSSLLNLYPNMGGSTLVVANSLGEAKDHIYNFRQQRLYAEDIA